MTSLLKQLYISGREVGQHQFQSWQQDKERRTYKTSSDIYCTASRRKSEMEGQGNIFKTLLITAAVYTLALGAPMKRSNSNNEMCNNGVTEACEAAKTVANALHNHSATINCTCEDTIYDPFSLAKDLLTDLTRAEVNFPKAVRETVVKCFNSNESSNEACQLAMSTITLLGTVRHFIEQQVNPYDERIDTETLNQNLTNCSRQTTEGDSHQVNQKLYLASKCTVECLEKLEGSCCKP